MRTSEQIINEIHSALGDGEKQGLRNTAALLEALQAWPACPVIHVAGTNGKGSVCAMLNSMLTAAGYKTGLYTSPFLQTYRERIRINGMPVPEEVFRAYGNETLDAADKLKKDRDIRCTPFELGTALAFRSFLGENTDLIIAETGMGGRLDPTNVIPHPAVCVITSIGMDHMKYLGCTLTEIACEKAGIIKPGVPAVCYPSENAEVRSVLIRRAEEAGAPLMLLEKDQVRIRQMTAYGTIADLITENGVREALTISLPGAHQAVNALTAVAAAEELDRQGISLPEDAAAAGLEHTHWPGRLEWHGNILMDGAHNAQGAAAFRRFVELLPKDRKKVLLTGVLEEKLSEDMLNELSATAEEAVTVAPDSPRAMPAGKLSIMLIRKGMKAQAANSLPDGLARARGKAGENGIILATGSLYFIGELRSELGLSP